MEGIDLDDIETRSGRQREDARRIHKLIAALGKERLAAISHTTLVSAATGYTGITRRRPGTAR